MYYIDQNGKLREVRLSIAVLITFFGFSCPLNHDSLLALFPIQRLYNEYPAHKTQQRTNRSFFTPNAHEDFESELSKPEKLVPPTPGWNQTPLHESNSGPKAGAVSNPTILPLLTTKLAAARSEDGSIHVFYQAKDESIRELVFRSAKEQNNEEDKIGRIVVDSGKAKSGTPLAVVAGGWMELRLFYVDKADLLKERYSDDHTGWIASESL